MKPRLQTSLGQHLVMTPQLRQAIRLLQLSTAELEVEIASAVESNPLLDWEEPAPLETHVDGGDSRSDGHGDSGSDDEDRAPADASAWDGDETWYERIGPADSDDEPLAEQVAEVETLQDHLLWQLHLSHLSQRDRSIGVAIIEAIDDDGYLRESFEAIAESLAPGMHAHHDEIATVLHQVQRFDPPGVGARTINECLQLQLQLLTEDAPGVALAAGGRPRIAIHRGYERMIRSASEHDAIYLRGRLQEARWLLKSLEARGDTLLKVMRCLLRQQSAFLEFGDQALRPLTLREVAGEVGLHESTISRAIARKYVRTPRGTIPLRAFFASGIDTGSGGEASSTAIQAMIRRLIEGEDPRKPMSDARLADSLKATGVPVARRTVAKYREAMSIPSSQDRLRIG